MTRSGEGAGPESTSTTRFDLQALFTAVDAERTRRRLTWSALSCEVGVSASTIRRLKTADDAEADGVLALLRWVDAAPEVYIAGSVVPPVRLGGGAELVRVDMRLVDAALDARPSASKRTRTTIQRLVDVAQRSQRPVAAFTRRSPV